MIRARFLAKGTGTGASVSTGTIAPVAGQLILAWVVNDAGHDNTLTGTGGLNVTWTAMNQLGVNAGTVVLWRGVPSSSTPGTLTFGLTTGSGSIYYFAVQYSGVDQTTNQGVVQSVEAHDNSGTATGMPVTLSAFATPLGNALNQVAYGAFAKSVNTTFHAPYTFETYWYGYVVTDTPQADANGTLGVMFGRSAGGDTGAGGGFGAAAYLAAIAVELKAAKEGVFWTSGAELGGVLEFGGMWPANTVTADQTHVRTGAWALKCSGGGIGLLPTNFGAYGPTAQATAYYRLYFYLTGAPTSTGAVFTMGDNFGTRTAVRMKTDRTFDWNFQGGAAIASGTGVATLDSWNLLELKIVYHASAGGVELKLNGVTEFTSFATNTTSGWGAITPSISSPPGRDIWWDDMAASDTDYPGAGQSIARNGKLGAPTYDTWTKTGGSTAKEVWSNTPSNESTYGTPSTNPQTQEGQTMKVAALDVDGSVDGHGADAIAPGAIINHCAVIVLAAAQGANNRPFWLRRRVGGLDVDTAANREASQKYATDGPWTATLDQLNAAEIGAVSGKPNAGQYIYTATTYDVWLLVDYTPSAAAIPVPKAPLMADRVQETTVTTGTGAVSLAGAVLGAITFAAAFDEGSKATYCIEDPITGAWEVGVGTVTGGTLTRDLVGATSVGTLDKVSFAAGTKRVFCPAGPARELVTVVTLGLEPGGRLTLTSGVPETTADVTGATAVRYVPYAYNALQLWDAGAGYWRTIAFDEIAHALGTRTSGAAYDIFAYLTTSRRLALDVTQGAWTNDTTRATAVSLEDGRWVKTGDKTRLLLGTYYTTATTTTEDSAQNRYLSNVYNRRPRTLRRVETGDNWAYSTATWRQANANAANEVRVMLATARIVTVRLSGAVTITAGGGTLGIGKNSTTAPTAACVYASGSGLGNIPLAAALDDADVGRHRYTWLERAMAASTVAFRGALADQFACGLTGSVEN